MKIKTEHLYSLSILFSIVGFTILFFQLLKKYSFTNIHRLENVCSNFSIEMNYSSFHTLGNWLGTFFLILTLLLIAKIFFSFLKIRQKASLFDRNTFSKQSKVVKKLTKKLDISSRSVKVIEEKKLIAITTGVFHPQIVLSTGLIRKLTETELEAVILHEVHHLKHFHPALILIGEVVASSLSFFPSIGELFKHFRETLEKEADAFACDIQGTHYHVEHALQRVRADHSQSFVSAFSAKNPVTRIDFLYGKNQEFVFSIKNIFTSFITFSCLIALLLLPVTVKAQAQPGSSKLQNCSQVAEGICTTFCQPGVFNFSSNQSTEPMTSNVSEVLSF